MDGGGQAFAALGGDRGGARYLGHHPRLSQTGDRAHPVGAGPPAPPIEAAIALSILFLGREILRARKGGTSFTIRHPWVVAFAFRLLHGFGFASAMSAAGLPPTDLPLALVSFNVGVELGQLAFVALVLLLERGVRAFRVSWPRPVELLPAYAVGSLGAFWLIQRVTLM